MGAITTYLASATVPIKPERVFIDNNAFLFNTQKEEYLKGLGVKIDKTILDLYLLMDELFPAIMEESFSVAAMKIKQNLSIASISGLDQPIAMTGAGQIEEAIANLFKTTIGLSFNEADQIKFHELMERGRIGLQQIEWITKNIEDLQSKIMRLSILLAAQVIMNGRVNWLDPRTKLTARMDYNYAPELFPDPLTGNNRWSQLATARGINDILSLADIYYRVNGFRPPYVVMRTEAVRLLQQQQYTRDQAIAMGLINTQAAGNPYVSFKRLNEMLEEMMLPTIRIWDAQVQIEPQPGVYQRINVIPDNKFCFALPKMGERIFGKTIESKGQTGIWVNLDPKDAKPTEDRVEAVGRFVPFVQDPKLLAAMTIN